MNHSKMRMVSLFVVGLMVIFTMPCCQGYTDEQDVFAISNLYTSLGSPPLPGWRFGGDPCVEGWQGVQCVNSNITAIILNGANLGGQLGVTLGNFTSIITIDLSDNHIGGNIPENLPLTMRNFFLSANQFTGTIPSSLSNLTLLSDMAVNNNLLEQELPDAFHSLTGLINLDLSSNNLSGQLPPSMESLSSLTTLHVQNNQLSGTLNILQDLPLVDLNIENNLFSGPIPEKLLTIPNFKKDGNPFNTTISPSSAPAPPPLPLSGSPVPSSDGPSIHNNGPPGRSKKNSTTRVIAYAAIAVTSLIIAVLMVIFCISKWQERKLEHEEIPKMQKVPKDNSKKQKEHAINMTRTGVLVVPPLLEKVTVNPIVPTDKIQRTLPQNLNPPTSVSSFSVASLQQYTNSFREENLISNDKLGKVYMAELPDGKLLTVTKLDNMNSNIPVDEFLELVMSISELQHPNILELVGYCMEFEQRLLVYNYFSKWTLHDILHCGDNVKKKLTWNARVQIALGAARALEYLHESCQLAVIHRDFESANILLDDRLAVRVSGCGLASLMLSNSVAQMSGQIRASSHYEAPEISDPGSYTDRSDVYSFGIVMLELLTGHKPYDSSRPREEQHLVRWASPQLYDINALSRMVDPFVDGTVPMKSLSWFADIINRCIQQSPEFRPLMSEVVQDLTCMIEDARMNANRTSI